jgi:hypothetical protein
VIVSSGGSDDSDPVEADFCGEPALLKYLELRSGRPEMLEVVDEICDCDWVARALEDRLGSVAAILCCGCRSDRENVDRVERDAIAGRGKLGRRGVSRLDPRQLAIGIVFMKCTGMFKH